MISYKSSDSTGTRGGVHMDFCFTESPNRPTLGRCHTIEGLIAFLIGAIRPMPVITVGLDNEPRLLEYKVGLEPPEHHLMHLKLQAPLPEFITQKPFNSRHFDGEMLAEPRLKSYFPKCGVFPLFERSLSQLGSNLRSPHGLGVLLASPWLFVTSQVYLPQVLPHLRGACLAKVVMSTKHRLAYLLSRLRRHSFTEHRLALLGPNLWRSFITSLRHCMFNYSTVGGLLW